MTDHEEELRQLGRAIAYYRTIRNMTQEDLACKAHISRTHLSNIEAPNSPKSISLNTLFNIADALGVTAADLLSMHPAPYRAEKDPQRQKHR